MLTGEFPTAVWAEQPLNAKSRHFVGGLATLPQVLRRRGFVTAAVPGILLSNRPIKIKDPGLGDLGHSVCSLLNVPADGLPGRDVFS